MQRFLMKLVEKGVQKALETEGLLEEGKAATRKEASEKVLQGALLNFQAEATRLQRLPREERMRELEKLKAEWGVQEALDWYMKTEGMAFTWTEEEP